jgi:hypothetical protein
VKNHVTWCEEYLISVPERHGVCQYDGESVGSIAFYCAKVERARELHLGAAVITVCNQEVAYEGIVDVNIVLVLGTGITAEIIDEEEVVR